MTKHTPGPWEIGNKGDFGTFNPAHIYGNHGADSVAHVYGVPLHTTLEEVDSARYAAGLSNARLIAAAPELLEALELVHSSTAVLNHLDREHIDTIRSSHQESQG